MLLASVVLVTKVVLVFLAVVSLVINLLFVFSASVLLLSKAVLVALALFIDSLIFAKFSSSFSSGVIIHSGTVPSVLPKTDFLTISSMSNEVFCCPFC